MRLVGSRFPRSARSLAFVLALGMLGSLVSSPGSAEGKKARRSKLDAINERWTGAELRLKRAFHFKGKKDDGWYKSNVFITREARTFKQLSYRLRVRDLEPLRSSIASGYLIPGTRFFARGFEFREPEDEQGIYLELVTADGGVEAEMVFFGSAGKPDLKGAEPIEQFLRLEVFDVRAADERLVTTAGGAISAPAGGAPFRLGPAPALPTAPIAAPPASEPVVFRPQLELLAVSVQPVQVAPGGAIELIASYSVAGLPPGAAFEVVERRSLLQGESRLTSDESPVARVNGTFTSKQTARIPAAASAGVYRLEVVLAVPGVEPVSASALFEVRP